MEANRKLRAVIAGCGTMGVLYAECLASIGNAELAGFYARPSDTASATAARFGTRLYASYEEALADPDVDVVCITLPTYLHRSYAVQAAESGKHVICEKPMALNIADAEVMLQASERYGTRLLVGHVLRFLPEYRNLREHARKGSIGKIGVGHAKRASLHPPAGSWFGNEEQSGGVLFDLMIHDIDFMRWTIGEVETVFATLRKAPGIEYANATLRFANGAIVNLEAFWGYPGPFRAEVELAGQAGVLRSSNLSAMPLLVQNKANPERQSEGVHIPAFLLTKDPFLLELEHFFDCIATETVPIVTAADGCKAIRIAFAAAESARTGQPCKV